MTHTRTFAYAIAPCGHKLPFPNEAYERGGIDLTDVFPYDSNGSCASVRSAVGWLEVGDDRDCDRRYHVAVIDGQPVFTEHEGERPE